MQPTSPASLGLPLRRGPVRFAVGAPEGLSSNSWRFWTHKGHAYLACRDNFQNMTVSLHASGRWRMAFTHQAVQQNPRLVPPCSDRAWEVWNEPPPTLPDTVITFRLLFFTSELAVRPDQRPTKTWKDTVFIEAAPPDSGLLTVVTFSVTKDDPELRHDSQPSVRLASLPLNEGRRVQLVAHREPVADHAIAIGRARDAVLAQATAQGIAVPDEGYLYLFGNQHDGARCITGARAKADSPLG
jgi:hypothetical protein